MKPKKNLLAKRSNEMEEYIYAEDIKGICPFCGNREFYSNAYRIAADDMKFVSETCTNPDCYSTFPYRNPEPINVMADDPTIEFARVH